MDEGGEERMEETFGHLTVLLHPRRERLITLSESCRMTRSSYRENRVSTPRDRFSTGGKPRSLLREGGQPTEVRERKRPYCVSRGPATPHKKKNYSRPGKKRRLARNPKRPRSKSSNRDCTSKKRQRQGSCKGTDEIRKKRPLTRGLFSGEKNPDRRKKATRSDRTTPRGETFLEKRTCMLIWGKKGRSWWERGR